MKKTKKKQIDWSKELDFQLEKKFGHKFETFFNIFSGDIVTRRIDLKKMTRQQFMFIAGFMTAKDIFE
jgi:hypothetical protein